MFISNTIQLRKGLYLVNFISFQFDWIYLEDIFFAFMYI